MCTCMLKVISLGMPDIESIILGRQFTKCSNEFNRTTHLYGWALIRVVACHDLSVELLIYNRVPNYEVLMALNVPLPLFLFTSCRRFTHALILNFVIMNMSGYTQTHAYTFSL